MKFTSKKIVFISISIALMVVLGIYFTINFYNMKITMQNLPLFVTGILYGPVAGAFVGFIGMLINQLLTYGFTATTFVWVLPHMSIGIIVGYIFEKKIVSFENEAKFCASIIFLNLILTVLNTFAWYIDSKVFGYYSFITIFGNFVIRIMIATITGIVYCAVIPPIIKILRKIEKKIH